MKALGGLGLSLLVDGPLASWACKRLDAKKSRIRAHVRARIVRWVGSCVRTFQGKFSTTHKWILQNFTSGEGLCCTLYA